MITYAIMIAGWALTGAWLIGRVEGRLSRIEREMESFGEVLIRHVESKL